MAKGIRVARHTKAVLLRLSSDVLARARATRVMRHVARVLDLDQATVTDVLREAVALGLKQLESEVRPSGGEVVRRVVEAPNPELAQFEREVMPLIREQIEASFEQRQRAARRRRRKQKV
jgi:hypothetical protein